MLCTSSCSCSLLYIRYLASPKFFIDLLDGWVLISSSFPSYTEIHDKSNPFSPAFVIKHLYRVKRMMHSVLDICFLPARHHGIVFSMHKNNI